MRDGDMKDRREARESESVPSDLRGPEAESGELGVGLLRVDHRQALLVIHTQVPACGDVADTERLPPFHVAPAPAAGRKEIETHNLKELPHNYNDDYEGRSNHLILRGSNLHRDRA